MPLAELYAACAMARAMLQGRARGLPGHRAPVHRRAGRLGAHRAPERLQPPAPGCHAARPPGGAPHSPGRRGQGGRSLRGTGDHQHSHGDERRGLSPDRGALRSMQRRSAARQCDRVRSDLGPPQRRPGFTRGLRELDRALPGLLAPVREEDLVIFTADHGNDPTTPSTDHSREVVPVLVSGPRVAARRPRRAGHLRRHRADGRRVPGAAAAAGRPSFLTRSGVTDALVEPLRARAGTRVCALLAVPGRCRARGRGRRGLRRVQRGERLLRADHLRRARGGVRRGRRGPRRLRRAVVVSDSIRRRRLAERAGRCSPSSGRRSGWTRTVRAPGRAGRSRSCFPQPSDRSSSGDGAGEAWCRPARRAGRWAGAGRGACRRVPGGADIPRAMPSALSWRRRPDARRRAHSHGGARQHLHRLREPGRRRGPAGLQRLRRLGESGGIPVLPPAGLDRGPRYESDIHGGFGRAQRHRPGTRHAGERAQAGPLPHLRHPQRVRHLPQPRRAADPGERDRHPRGARHR